MSYSFTKRVPETGVFEVSCIACRNFFGTMTGDAIARAIQKRGPVICPECRKRHCDFCGRITRYRLPFQGVSPWRACPLCVSDLRTRTWPKATRVVWIHGTGKWETGNGESRGKILLLPEKCGEENEGEEAEPILTQ